MSDEPASNAEPPGDSEGSPPNGSPGDEDAGDDEEWVPFEGLSQEGLLLVFAGLACGLAALTAQSGGQPQPVVAFGAAAAVVALAAFAVDLLTDVVPPLWIHLAVGGGASVAGAFALAGRHWVNAGTFAVAAALVLFRVVDVEYRDAEYRGAD